MCSSDLPHRFGAIRFARLNAAAARLLREIGLEIAPDRPVHTLGVGQQQLVDIAAGLSEGCDLLILDDFAYVSKDQAETSVLFELISARYERRSLLITANQPFGDWNKVFPDPAMTLAAVDRLVHHATIFEMNVESYRRRTALQRKQHGPGRPAKRATPKNLRSPPADNQQPQ